MHLQLDKFRVWVDGQNLNAAHGDQFKGIIAQISPDDVIQLRPTQPEIIPEEDVDEEGNIFITYLKSSNCEVWINGERCFSFVEPHRIGSDPLTEFEFTGDWE